MKRQILDYVVLHLLLVIDEMNDEAINGETAY